jgi:hypothetical protein
MAPDTFVLDETRRWKRSDSVHIAQSPPNVAVRDTARLGSVDRRRPMLNPFSDFWEFLIGHTDDHNFLGSWKYVFVALFLTLLIASVVIAARNWQEDPSQRTASDLATWC